MRTWSANNIEPSHLHGCACWPGSILVAKADHFWFQQGYGSHANNAIGLNFTVKYLFAIRTKTK